MQGRQQKKNPSPPQPSPALTLPQNHSSLASIAWDTCPPTLPLHPSPVLPPNPSLPSLQRQATLQFPRAPCAALSFSKLPISRLSGNLHGLIWFKDDSK